MDILKADIARTRRQVPNTQLCAICAINATRHFTHVNVGYLCTLTLSSALHKMLRRLFRSIKNYIRGGPRPTPTKKTIIQAEHSSYCSDPGCVASLSPASPVAGRLKRYGSHCPVHNPVASTSTTPLPLRQQPENIEPFVSSDSQPPPTYVEAPLRSALSTSTNEPLHPARDAPYIGVGYGERHCEQRYETY